METKETYVDYKGVDHAGRQLLVTVWDSGETWVQTRDTSWDTWGRPVRCHRINPQTGRTSQEETV